MEISTKENIIEKENDNNDYNQGIDTLLKNCVDAKPLQLVDNVERMYNLDKKDKNDKNDFYILQNYRRNNERKFDLIDFEIKTQNDKIKKKIKEINCIKIYENNLYMGLKDGYVYLYEIENGFEKESYGVENFKTPVSVINTKENTHLLVGYENGVINIFDIKTKLLFKNIPNIHKTKIIDLEYILIEKNNIQLLSTDEECQVINISSYNSFLSKKTVGNLLYKETEPVHSIIKFKPYENKKIVIYGFISPSKIRIYNLKLSPILEINKPKYAEKKDIPDIAIGWGIPPCTKNDKINNEILLLLGWGKIITIYIILTKGDNIRIEDPVGYYINNSPIIKIGFYSSSIIYFFDENKKIKVLNSAFFNKGLYDENKNGNKDALVDEGKIVDKNIKYNFIKRNQNEKYENYNNYIFCMKQLIYIFTDSGLKIGKILNYMELTDNIIKSGNDDKSGNNYKSAMCLAIDMYKGDIENFPGIPLNKEERKKNLNSYLFELINRYIDYTFNSSPENDNDNDNDNNNIINNINNEFNISTVSTEYSTNISQINNISEIKDDTIKECINICIEFCLEIKSIDYLLKDIEPTFSNYGREDLFYKLLEPFIFRDKFHNEDIGIEALTSLYGAFKIKDELVLLSHLLTHLNLKCLNNFMIKKLSLQENLFDIIIYIFSNGVCAEDFFLPITKMFQYFSNNLELNSESKEDYKEVNDYKFLSYYDSFIVKDINGINKMEKTKEYIGHKLMWYIDMCLRGNKFASGIEIDLLRFNVNSYEYKKFIAYIYFWILREDIFLTLLRFDSYTLFNLLLYLFTERDITKIIKNFDFSTINDDSLDELIKQQENGSYLVLDIKKLNEIKEKQKKEEEKKEETEDKKEEKEEEEDKEEKEEDENKNEIKEIKETKEKEEKENYDPFAMKGTTTHFGSGVKLNNLNNVLEYIIKLVESQTCPISRLDLSTFLIKYGSKGEEKITDEIHKKIFEAFIYCLKFFLEYPMKRKDLISKNEDKFNIHNLTKKVLDGNDPYFDQVSKMLSDLITSENVKFTEEELFKIKLASGKPFNLINIKIAELSKNYKDCLKLYLDEEIQKNREKVFTWLEDKFQNFNKELNINNNNNDLNENNNINENKKYYSRFIDAIIDKISELVKLSSERTKRVLGKYLKNNDKLKIYFNLKSFPETQFDFLELLLYQNFEKIKSENEENMFKKETIEENDLNKNLDLFQIYLNNIEDEKNTKNNLNKEKIIREQFDNLLIDQIKLLIKLKREKEVKKYLEKNIPYYPTYPLREVLNKCIEKNIIDSAIYIYQVLNENRSSLNLTLQILDKSFKEYKLCPKKEQRDNFLANLNLSINICKENSESILKKDKIDKMKKDTDSEGEELWFDLLKKLYELEDSLEDNENKEKIKETLQKGIATLLKEICSYVRIQKLINYVTEKQEKAQYKEYKTIVETMLRSNNSFDRVLKNVTDILRKSIDDSESSRKKVTSKGNSYNIKKCDVCYQFFRESKDEIVYFFGCGHQSHEKCCHKKKKNINKNRIILNEENDEGDYIVECEVCRKNKINEDNKDEDEYENFILNEDREIADNVILNKNNIKMKAFKFGNKKDKFKKLDKYDMKYQNETSIFD